MYKLMYPTDSIICQAIAQVDTSGCCERRRVIIRAYLLLSSCPYWDTSSRGNV